MIIVDAKPGRVRIAISSPEILAHIRHEFASKGLDVQIDGLPSVDVVITPGSGVAPATGALADALSGLAGPQTRHKDPATARYRLAVVPHGNPAAKARRLTLFRPGRRRSWTGSAAAGPMPTSPDCSRCSRRP
ncbi:hypothetical protein [Paractinoplanes durhamensis]|uniref:hypothetical protein n=1 Tax=Paractinoplanes durhamensis TaxID=113563 RepID=UPI00362C0B97